MSDIFQIPAECTKLETLRNQAVRLKFDSQENISAEEMKRLLENRNKLGWLSFVVSRQVEPDDLLNLPELKTDSKKSQGQRQRAVIYRIWERDHHGYDDFNLFYEWFMEKHIQWLKEKYLT